MIVTRRSLPPAILGSIDCRPSCGASRLKWTVTLIFAIAAARRCLPGTNRSQFARRCFLRLLYAKIFPFLILPPPPKKKTKNQFRRKSAADLFARMDSAASTPYSSPPQPTTNRKRKSPERDHLPPSQSHQHVRFLVLFWYLFESLSNSFSSHTTERAPLCTITTFCRQ